jgi:two-component system alkaline phosphatase synthesis response regulator PhoP
MTETKSKSKSATVLIVEDENMLNEAYQVVLKTSGYNVLTAYDGKEALEILEKHTADIILLDLRMPVLDGVGFLEAYQLKSRKNPPKVVVFSNFDMQKEIDQAYELGADKYMLKAWASPKELLQLISNLLKEK